MKNIHSIKTFRKLFEADKFASDVSFSDSLIGRGFNSIFKILRKSANKGRLIFFKRKLEDEYIKAVLASIEDEQINEILKPKEQMELEINRVGEESEEEGLEFELGKEILALPLPKEEGISYEDEGADFGEDEKEKIKLAPHVETEKETQKEKPFVFTRYEEIVKTINKLSESATEDDVKIVKKIKEDLTEITEDIKIEVTWRKSQPEYIKSDRRKKEVEVFEKEYNYVIKLINACDNIINKFKVKDELSDNEYAKLIASVKPKSLKPKEETGVTKTQTDVSKSETDVQTSDEKSPEKIKGEVMPAEQIKVGGKVLKEPEVEIIKNDDIFKKIASVYNKLKKALPHKEKELKKIYNKFALQTHPDKGGTTDINVLKQFYDALKTIESVLFTYENTSFRNFTIDQKLYEAEAILERSNKNSKKLNKRLKTSVSDVTGDGRFGDTDLAQLDDKKLKEVFAKNPKLIQLATSKVNIEAVKDIEYSARLIYDPNVSVSNTILKNFKNNEADAKQYELFWKKLVAKVKKEFHGLLDLNKVDPLKLVNDEETNRGGTGVKSNAKSGNPSTGLMAKIKEQEDLKALEKMGVLVDKKPDTSRSTVSHAVIETAITNPEVHLIYLLVDVFIADGDKAMFRIVNMYDGLKIVKEGEERVIAMADYRKLKIDDEDLINKYKFGKEYTYYQRIHSSKSGGSGKLNTLTVYRDDISTNNHFSVWEFEGDSLKPVEDKSSANQLNTKMPILGYFDIKHDAEVYSKWEITETTKKQLEKNSE